MHPSAIRVRHPAGRRLNVPLAGLALLVSLCAAATASAQVACPASRSTGSPPLNERHIFCGEINKKGKATGFHSRPGGVNPATISGGTVEPVPGAPAGIYAMSGVTVTEGGKSAEKTFSTMYPDTCSKEQVAAAIRNAAADAPPGGKFKGSSGTACMAGDPPAPFPIVGFTNGGTITTAWPDF